MTVDEFKQIGVVGAGTMGRGIAHLFALHGFPVILVDRDGSAEVKASPSALPR